MKNPIQWHPGFNAVMQIEFEEECDKLRFEAEHNLGKKPLQIDLLVVKLDGGASIRKNIGRIFRKYNIIEYKSPKDYLSVNDFYKVMGYTCFYQADTKHVLEIQPDELTITFVSSQYPKSMMKHLKNSCKLDIKCIERGIYYVYGALFPIQLIIINCLSETDNFWLSRLRANLDKKIDIEPLISAYSGKEGNSLYEAAMNLMIRANKNQYEEALIMCDALRELVEEIYTRDKEQIQARWKSEFEEEFLKEYREELRAQIREQFFKQCVEQGREQGREQGIQSAIAICIQLGASRDIAFKNLCEKFSLTESQAEEYLQKYWTEKSA